jgi:tRNA-uridine 2-sulfurtransferase
MSKRVFTAMSGGVDSSVAAHLLKQAGYEVSGIHLELFPKTSADSERNRADLEHTCQLLQIPLHYLRPENEFKDSVINYFCEEYSRGRTPNPCIRCNKYIKFGRLLEKVLEMGGDYLATGHYARVEASQEGRHLLKGADPAKDQSYFLYVLGQKELSQVLFPVGGMRKSEVKQLAAKLGLPAAVRRESQDICFIPNNDTYAFINDHLSPKPGDIVDIEGNILGQHPGLAYYTVGQRQGMQVSASERLYVIRLEAETNRLVIGPQPQLFKKKLTAYDLNWVSGKPPQNGQEVNVKVRYRSPEVKATLQLENSKAEVCFAEPQKALAPGQAAVFYVGDEVAGGGTIGETG